MKKKLLFGVIILFLLVGFIDLHTTKIGIDNYSWRWEGNPLARLLFAQYGYGYLTLLALISLKVMIFIPLAYVWLRIRSMTDHFKIIISFLPFYLWNFATLYSIRGNIAQAYLHHPSPYLLLYSAFNLFDILVSIPFTILYYFVLVIPAIMLQNATYSINETQAMIMALQMLVLSFLVFTFFVHLSMMLLATSIMVLYIGKFDYRRVFAILKYKCIRALDHV